LILEDRGRRGTFLPSVWEQLPEPADFLAHLRRKAGLPAGYWSETLRVSRYRTESFGTTVAVLRDPSIPQVG
jgi:AMMECR1 domain-containing protein